MKSFPSRTQPSPPFLPLNANFCGLKFPFHANRFTRGRISALLKIPLSRAEWNPFRKNFTIRFLSISAPLPRQVPIRKKNVRFAHCCRAPLPFRNFDSNNTTARRTLRRTRKNPLPAGNGDGLFFTAKLQFLASDSSLPIRRVTPENFHTPRRHGRIRANPADAECSNAPRQYDAPLNQRNPKLQRGFFTSLIRGRVCFRLSPPPPARGRRRRVPRS